MQAKPQEFSLEYPQNPGNVWLICRMVMRQSLSFCLTQVTGLTRGESSSTTSTIQWMLATSTSQYTEMTPSTKLYHLPSIRYTRTLKLRLSVKLRIPLASRTH